MEMVGHSPVHCRECTLLHPTVDGSAARVTRIPEPMQRPGAHTDAQTLRSAQEGASVSNETRDVEDQADACGRACGNRQAAYALSCSQPERRTFHKAWERVDVLIAQFLVTKVAGQALVWWFQHRRGPLKSSRR